jgi:hypothetical protein
MRYSSREHSRSGAIRPLTGLLDTSSDDPSERGSGQELLPRGSRPVCQSWLAFGKRFLPHFRAGVATGALVRAGSMVCAQLVGVDTVPEASPTLAALTARCDARTREYFSNVLREVDVGDDAVAGGLFRAFGLEADRYVGSGAAARHLAHIFHGRRHANSRSREHWSREP